jgi:hypothetical protein
MKQKQILALVIAAVLLGGLAYLTSRKDAAKAPNRMGEPLIAGLSVNDISTIRMIGKDGTTTLTRTPTGWTVPSKFGHPANFDKLRTAVVALDDLNIEHEIEATDKQKADMNISEASERVQLLDEANVVLGEIVLGDTREQDAPQGSPYGGYPNGRFVSTDGGETVVVISDPLSAFAGVTALGWLDTEMLSVNAADVASIRIAGPDREAISCTAGDDGKLTLADLKAGAEADADKLTSLQSALSYMRFSDVADPSLTDETLGMDTPIVFEAMTKNGTLHMVKLGKTPEGSENRYARVSVSYIGNDESVDAAAAPEEDEAAKLTREADIEAAREAATQLNTKLANWTYVIPSYKAGAMTTLRNDLIKAPEVSEGVGGEEATSEVEASPAIAPTPVTETAAAAEPQTATEIANEDETAPEDK